MSMQTAITILLLPMIVLALSGIVLLARWRLAPSGEVSILVNDGQSLTVPAGNKLLESLAGEGIYLPSPCGGRGSCGQCRVVVERGGGEPLLTESAQISRRDLDRNLRLACQVVVRDDLAIRLPEDLLEARRWSCRVASNRNISTLLTELVLEVDEADEFDFEAGAYVLLEAPAGNTRFADFDIEAEYRPFWEQNRLFDLVAHRPEPVTRAYSLANPPEKDGKAALVIRIALPPAGAPSGTPPGQVSSFAFALKPGDTVTIAGPYGMFQAQDTDREMVFIGGGAGMGPLRSIILDQLRNRQSSRKITFFYGARSNRDLCYVDEFDALASEFGNFEWHVALSNPEKDTEWTGPIGFIHQIAYDKFLEQHPRPEEIEYYLCGPPVMSNAVIAMLEDLGVEAQNIFHDDFGS